MGSEFDGIGAAAGAAAGGGSGGSGTPGAGVVQPGQVTGGGQTQAQSPAVAASIASEIYEKYLRDRLAQVEVPQVQLQRDELNQNAAQFAVEAALKDARFKQLELPMAEDQRKKLLSDIADTAWQQTFKERQLDTETGLQRAGLTLQAAKQAADEAMQRDTTALEAYKSAEQMDMARGKQAQEGYLAADQAALDREKFSAFDLAGRAEDQMLSREKFGVDTAERAARLGLDTAKENANLRGARNAFQQQSYNFGVNANGLSKAVDALKGAPGITAYQAPGAPAQRATLGTIADDIRLSGPGTDAPSAFELMNRSATQNLENPIGIGTQTMLDVSDRYAYDPYTANIQRTMQIADQDLAGRQGDMYGRVAGLGDKQQDLAYNSPSSAIALDVAGRNQIDAGPDQASVRLKNAGADVIGAYTDVLAQRKAGAIYQHLLNDQLKAPGVMDKLRAAWASSGGDAAKFVQAAGFDPYQGLDQMNSDALTFLIGRDETPVMQQFFADNGAQSVGWDDPQLVSAVVERTGLNAADATEILQDGADYYTATGRVIPADLLSQKIVGRTAQSNVNGQATDQGAAGRLNDAYGNYLRTTHATGLSADDPTLLGMYQSLAPMGPDAARLAAERAADAYRASGKPIPTGFQAANIGDARAQYPNRWTSPNAPDPRGEKIGPMEGKLPQYGVAGTGVGSTAAGTRTAAPGLGTTDDLLANRKGKPGTTGFSLTGGAGDATSAIRAMMKVA